MIDAIAATARAWCDPSSAPRRAVERALRERTGYSGTMVAFALDQLLQALTPEAIRAILVDELGVLDALSIWQRGDGVAYRAQPLGEVVIISSRTTIGVALYPAVFALLAGNRIVVKDRADGFLRAFFAGVVAAAPALDPFVRIETWNGHDDTHLHAALAAADAVVAFGGDDALRTIRALARPGARFIAYGPRASAGYLTRESLADATTVRACAAGASRDLLLYDSEGCLSLHVLFIEAGGPIDADQFIVLLGDALAATETQFPGASEPSEAAFARAGERARAEFRGAAIASAPGVPYIVTRAAMHDAPRFVPRALPVLEVGSPADCVTYVRRHRLAIEALATAPGERRSDLEQLALDLGAARIAPFGVLQTPPLATHHGGRPRIAEFVRWVNRDG